METNKTYYTKYTFEELNIESVGICMYPFDSNSMQTGLIKKRGVASDAPFLDNLRYTNYDEERPS